VIRWGSGARNGFEGSGRRTVDALLHRDHLLHCHGPLRFALRSTLLLPATPPNDLYRRYGPRSAGVAISRRALRDDLRAPTRTAAQQRRPQ